MTSIFAPGLFAGRTVLVTGGGTGIGFAIAQELGALGAAVVIAARNAERLAAASAKLGDEGIDSTWHQVDIRNDQQVAALFDGIPTAKGTCAGVIMRAMSRNIALATPGAGLSACKVTQAMMVTFPAGK